MLRRKSFIWFVLMVLFMLPTFGCSSKVVPPGTTIIVVSANGETNTYTKGSYVAYGRDRVYYLDTKLKSFTEKMKILCKDKVNMSVDIKWVGSFDASTQQKVNIIKTKVPAVKREVDGAKVFTLSLQEFYNTAMKDIVRANTRSIVAPYVTDVIPDNRDEIEQAIRKRVLARLAKLNYPIQTSDILVSNLDFDPAVTKRRQDIKKAELDDELKAAQAKANVAQAKRDDDLAREKGKALITSAMAQAKANKILNGTLTDRILKKEFYVAMKEMAKSDNNQLLIVPYDAMAAGQLPGYLNRQTLMSK